MPLRAISSANAARPAAAARPRDLRLGEPRASLGPLSEAGRGTPAASIEVDNKPRREIVRHMLNYQTRDLDRVFGALVDPTRREILARLEREETVSISALAAPFAIKLPAVMKHLDVLSAAGLITRSKHGRTVDVKLSPDRLRE